MLSLPFYNLWRRKMWWRKIKFSLKERAELLCHNFTFGEKSLTHVSNTVTLIKIFRLFYSFSIIMFEISRNGKDVHKGRQQNGTGKRGKRWRKEKRRYSTLVIEAKIIFETNQPNILEQENFFLIFDGQ